MRRSAGPAALLTLLLAPALAAAGPIGVNVLLASQMVEPNPSPGKLTLPTGQPGDLLLTPGGEVTIGSIRFDDQRSPQSDGSYVAATEFSVFVKLTDLASGQTGTLRVDGNAVDQWDFRDWDGRWTNPYHNLEVGDYWNGVPYTTGVVLGGHDYVLRVDRKDRGTAADFVLSAGAAPHAPEPGTLLLGALALVPAGLRALRRRRVNPNLL